MLNKRKSFYKLKKITQHSDIQRSITRDKPASSISLDEMENVSIFVYIFPNG